MIQISRTQAKKRLTVAKRERKNLIQLKEPIEDYVIGLRKQLNTTKNINARVDINYELKEANIKLEAINLKIKTIHQEVLELKIIKYRKPDGKLADTLHTLTGANVANMRMSK